MAEEISEGRWSRRCAVQSCGEKGLRKWLEESCKEGQRSVVSKRDGGKWWRREREEYGGGR